MADSTQTSIEPGSIDSVGEKELAPDPMTDSLSPDMLQRFFDFCRKNNLAVSNIFLRNIFQETEAILRKETNSVLGAVGGTAVENIFADYKAFVSYVNALYDVVQAEVSNLLYPVFAHCYLNLVDHDTLKAKKFYEEFFLTVPRIYEEFVVELGTVLKISDARENHLVQILRTQPFVARLTSSTHVNFSEFLNNNVTVRNIVKERILLETSEHAPKNKAIVTAQSGGVLGHPSMKDQKKHKVFYGVLREDSPYADRRQLKNKESKELVFFFFFICCSKKREQMAPLPDRIPLPNSEMLKHERGLMVQQAVSNMVHIDKNNKPSILFFNILNSGGSVCCTDVSDDTTMLAIGTGNSVISLYPIGENRKLHILKDAEDLEKLDYDIDIEDLPNKIYDERTKFSRKTLSGHGGPVFAVNFDPCKRLLVSGGYDATVRLWSVDTFRPVWDVKFCSRGYYFAVSTGDHTVTVWSTERVHPLRIFPDSFGNVRRIDYHPNCNYVAGGGDDRYVRLWDVHSGSCVRSFTGHKSSVRGVKISPCGRYIVSVAQDGTVNVWDIATQKLIGSETRGLPTTMASIAFTREGDTFAVSHGVSSISIFSLQELVNTYSNQDGLSQDPLLNPEDFKLYQYPTKQSPVIGLHWTRRNLLLGVGSYMQ